MRIPGSTYRLQFHAGFRFDDARRTVPYLHLLGVTDVYASPLLAARPGSMHGYDVVDPTRLDPELGTQRDFERLVRALRKHDMGLLVDVVPNHMAMSSDNPWWMDVLANGRASRYAAFFDIDWEARALGGKVLVPVLAAPYADVLARGELRLDADDMYGIVVRYFEHSLPVDARTWPRVLAGAEHRAVRSLVRSLERLPPRTDTRAGEAARRRRGVVSARRRLRALLRHDVDVHHELGRILRWWNGEAADEAGTEERFEALDSLIGEQAWLLSNWRAARREIDYRRFFEIADLVALCSQEEEVFRVTHELVVRLVRDGAVMGLRIDHVDGLWDPQGYLERLRDATGGAYVVVEKILGRGERLPASWPVAGTTGYDFLNAANDLWVQPAGWERLRDEWTAGSSVGASFDDLVHERKRAVIEQLFAGEVDTLSSRLQRLAREDRYGRDLTRAELAEAFIEVTAALPVYRTYVRTVDVCDADRAYIDAAVTVAQRRNPPEYGPALTFVRRVLTLDLPSRRGGRARAWLAFVMRWQQFTGPVMAKGFEDTALYVWNPLVSRNEVGSEPAIPPASVGDFHAWQRQERRRERMGLLTTSTHDTKRSEDVRARIDVLSEMADAWARRVARWRAANAGRRRRVGRPDDVSEAPDPNEEWLLYQTLLGVWPLATADERDVARRVREYVRKALREAKIHSNWIEPDERYERAVDRFVASVLSRSNIPFLRELRSVAREVAFFGTMTALAQTVLKVGSPGVPDLYQGTETMALRLVDPDNRASVDLGAAEASLRAMDEREATIGGERCAEELIAAWSDGRVKQWVTSRALRCRRVRPSLFSEGSYEGLPVEGARADHVIAFERRHGDARVVAVAARWFVRLCPGGRYGGVRWGDTAIDVPPHPAAAWTDALTGRRLDAPGEWLPVNDMLAVLPAALLVPAESS